MRALLIGSATTVFMRFIRGLEDHGWQVAAADIPACLAGETLKSTAYDMAIIDVANVDTRLQTLLDTIRRHNNETVVMVLGKFSVSDRVRALNFGADDFLDRDVSMELLLSRATALLMLSTSTFRPHYVFEDLTIDLVHRQVNRAKHEIALSKREFQLLVLLARHAGQTLSRSTIIEQLWEQARTVDDNSLDALVSRLRRKLDRPFGRNLLYTVRGVGFRLGLPE